MKEPLVILFPDLRGVGVTGTFGRTLLETYGRDEHVHLVPVINGIEPEALDRISRSLHPKFTPAPANLGPGQLNALRAGYRFVLNQFPGATIVRLDTNEHPIELIPTLAKHARDHDGMAIGNLTYGPDLIIPGSADELFLAVCPTLYATATGSALQLSGVHGFQAFTPYVCGDVMEAAEEIVAHANDSGSNQPLTWGYCGAMALGAMGIGTPVHVMDISATQPRNRPPEKVATQLIDFTRTVVVAVKIYDYDEP